MDGWTSPIMLKDNGDVSEQNHSASALKQLLIIYLIDSLPYHTAATKHRYIPRCQCRMANLWGIYGVRVIEVIYGGYMVKMGHIP